MDVPISRKEAKALGLGFYFTGKPCIRGHVDIRRVVNLTCEECNRENGRLRAAADPDRYRQKGRESYQRNAEARKAGVMRWRRENPEKVKGYSYACQKKRSKTFDSPLVEKHKDEIRKIYSDRPESMTIDHIVPINHPLVCGLHVPWNLQYLTQPENAKKGNKFPWKDSDQLPAG